MRLLNSFIIAMAFCALVAAQEQATIVQGYATTWATQPFVPLLATPEMSLDQPPLATGASNATTGLVTGTSNSTLLTETTSTAVTATEPAPANQQAVQADGGFEFGSATSQNSFGVAALVGSAGRRAPAQRSYTNDDIVRLNQETGTVKYNGKTEELR